MLVNSHTNETSVQLFQLTSVQSLKYLQQASQVKDNKTLLVEIRHKVVLH